MSNTMNRKPRNSRVMVRAMIVALCFGAAPVAMAHSSGDSAPDGAGYLLSYGSNYHHSGGFHDGGVGGYGGSRHDVPEPATWGMFGLGLAMIGMGVASRRRRIGPSSD